MKYVNFTFIKMNDFQYKVSYVVKDEKNRKVFSECNNYIYSPIRSVSSMKEAKKKIAYALRMRLKSMFEDESNYSIHCDNPKEDFIEKTVHVEPKTVPSSLDKERLYEVVELDGCYGIIKHKEPFYTEEQAKTVLMARILNEGE